MDDDAELTMAERRRYRVRKGSDNTYTEVSEQEYLDAVARQHRFRAGSLKEEDTGLSILDAPEKRGDIKLPERDRTKMPKGAGAAFVRGLRER